MREVRCKHCGKPFKTNESRACYCSAECKIAGGKAMRTAWETRNRNYNADYYRKKRKASES